MGWERFAYAGQKVGCVGCKGTPKPDGFWDEWRNYWGITLPQRGSSYTVRDVRVAKNGVVFIRLNEIVNPVIEFVDAPDDEPWFAAHAFRPVQPKSTETGMKIIRKILDRAPVKEDA